MGHLDVTNTADMFQGATSGEIHLRQRIWTHRIVSSASPFEIRPVEARGNCFARGSNRKL